MFYLLLLIVYEIIYFFKFYRNLFYVLARDFYVDFMQMFNGNYVSLQINYLDCEQSGWYANIAENAERASDRCYNYDDSTDAHYDFAFGLN